jgi:hypothetical protein
MGCINISLVLTAACFAALFDLKTAQPLCSFVSFVV